MRRWLAPALLAALIVGAWQLAASSGALADLLNLEPFLVPSPLEIGESVWHNRALLAENASVTLREIVLGIFCAALAGLAFAVSLHFSRTLRLAFYPLLIASQTVPVPVIAPILIVWFGFGILPKIVVVALVCFFPIVVNTVDGLRSVDPATIKLMRTLDASRWQIFTRVEAHAALPHFLTGAKIGAVVAPIAAVFGEWTGSSAEGAAGLGHLIRIDEANLEVARQFASVLILSLLALALFGVLALAERRILAWR